MTNAARPRLSIPAAAKAQGRWVSPKTGRVYIRRGSKWRDAGYSEKVEPTPKRAKHNAATKPLKIPLGARQRMRPYVEAMSNWQRNNWARGMSGGAQGYSVDPRRLLFHVCFRKPPLKPDAPAIGQAKVDRQIDLALARKMGQTGPRLGLDGKQLGRSPGAFMAAWKATKDFLARQRQRMTARATRAAQRQ